MKIKDTAALIASALKPMDTSNAVTLLGTEFLLMPSVHLVGAVTKNGKTNFAANLVVDALALHREGKVFVALNEETPEDFVVRCACLMANIPFYVWKTGKVTETQRSMIAGALQRIVPRISMPAEDETNLSFIEDTVSAVSKAAQGKNLVLVILDYIQNVQLSRKTPALGQYEILKRLGTALKDVGKKTRYPIVVLGQLKEAMTVDGQDRQGFKGRVEGDTWFVNNMASGIELKAFKKERLTSLTVHVDRFQGLTHTKYWFEHQPSGRLTRTNKEAGGPDLVEEEEGNDL